MINETCHQFNNFIFENEELVSFSEALNILKTMGFDQYIDTKTLHTFNNENLEMDFYPVIEGNYLKDNQGDHYMLVAVQQNNSSTFYSPVLLMYAEPYFSFPHQDNYIQK